MGCGQNCIKQSSMKETKTQYLESLQHENTTQVHAISIQSQPLIQYQLILQETKPPKKPAIHSQDNSDLDINFENNEFNIEHFSAIRCVNRNHTQSSEQTSKIIMKHLNNNHYEQFYNQKKQKHHRNKSKTKKKIDMKYLEDQF